MLPTLDSAIRSTIIQAPYTTADLLQKLSQQGHLTTMDYLMKQGKNLKVGLARDGYWYPQETNTEIAQAYAVDAYPFYMEQYFRNRT